MHIALTFDEPQCASLRPAKGVLMSRVGQFAARSCKSVHHYWQWPTFAWSRSANRQESDWYPNCGASRTIMQYLEGFPVLEGHTADAGDAVLYARHHVVLASRQEHAGAGAHPASNNAVSHKRWVSDTNRLMNHGGLIAKRRQLCAAPLCSIYETHVNTCCTESQLTIQHNTRKQCKVTRTAVELAQCRGLAAV